MIAMIVCESNFVGVDPDYPDFIGGIDVYGHLPYGAAEPQHRLTMGKDRITGEYIAWKRYHERVEIISRKGITGFIEREGKVIKVVQCRDQLSWRFRVSRPGRAWGRVRWARAALVSKGWPRGGRQHRNPHHAFGRAVAAQIES